jgi:hypothetical protein
MVVSVWLTNGIGGKETQPRKSPNNSKARGSNQKGAKPKGACFNCNKVGHYSKDCPKSKSGVGSFQVLALNATLAQKECNRLIFLKGKIFKREILCLLDTGASHNFVIRESTESVAPLLWPSVGLKPNTWKSWELESSGTPKCLELDSKRKNTLH